MSAQRGCCHPSAPPQPLLFQSIHPPRRLPAPGSTAAPVISTYRRRMAALLSQPKPGGQSSRVAYVTQTSQTPGGDEKQSGLFARSTLSALLATVFPR